jgi:hypothetical protein
MAFDGGLHDGGVKVAGSSLMSSQAYKVVINHDCITVQ